MSSHVADPKHVIVRKQIQSVEFGFYVDADVRSRSVVEITSPQAFDAMGTALPRGLYDARLGPYDKSSQACVTCGCGYMTCPGHASHLELAVPVYHPILFPLVVKLLKAKCLHCHRFRMDKVPMMTMETKFKLLHAGRLQESLELDTTLAQSVKTKLDETTSKGKKTRADTKYEQVLQDIQETIPASGKITLTSYEREQIRLLQKEFMTSCLAAKKCSQCGAFSPKIRQDSSNKIFQAPLSATSARINMADGIAMESALAGDHDDDDDDRNPDKEEDEASTSDEPKESKDKFMHSLEVEAQVQLTWARHVTLCHYIFGPSAATFFMRAIPIPPPRFRPPMVLGSMTVENSQNAYLNKMLTTNDRIRSLLANEDAKSQNQAFSAWIDLQTTVNCFMDSSKDPSAGTAQNNGIRQVLEKKEGIFRKHMMGKRVDFCCRSVISPDPYVGSNEIGIPLVFAKTLTYPTPVSDLNVQELRELVNRGPHNYPGASWVQFPDGRRVELSKMGRTKREAISARLLALLNKSGPPVTVGRQLRTGDMMLVNRQVRGVSLQCIVTAFFWPRMRYQVMHHSEVFSMLDYDIPTSARLCCLASIEIC
jgi:DNA-directed RNA polymerase I subunit RPA1